MAKAVRPDISMPRRAITLQEFAAPLMRLMLSRLIRHAIFQRYDTPLPPRR